MSFPTRIADLTVEWLSGVFAARGLLDGRRLVRFEAAPAALRGGTSSVRVLTLTYDPPGGLAPQKVLAKFSSESESVREAAREYRLYQREIAFYAHCGADPGIPTPACYAAEYDARANTCVLLLEYLENARTRESLEDGPGAVEVAVRCLAPFHAKWWGRASSLTFIESEYAPSSVVRRMEKVARALGRIQAGGHRGELGETCFAILELWLAHARAWADYCQRRPLTLCHGSYHRGQILFTGPDPGSPWVIDWQNVSLNCGAHDLARIVISGLLPDQRRRCEPALLAAYHALLVERGVRDYSPAQLRDDYRLGIVSLIVFHALMFADYPVEVVAKYWKEKHSFWEVLFHWPGAAAEEAGALEWLRQTVRSLPGPS
jgi:hypothetical protein